MSTFSTSPNSKRKHASCRWFSLSQKFANKDFIVHANNTSFQRYAELLKNGLWIVNKTTHIDESAQGRDIDNWLERAEHVESEVEKQIKLSKTFEKGTLESIYNTLQ